MQNTTEINNEIYETLGERWYTAYDDPVALLRSESRTKSPWITARIEKEFGPREDLKVLDVGCGAGFLSNHLALAKNYRVTGVDLSKESLSVARKHDSTSRVTYVAGDAYALPFSPAQFDVVTCMDFLEHVENPGLVIAEVARVLKPGGLFFFHTFNRNFLSHLVIIKLVEWLVKNTPKNMHVPELFIKPDELKAHCRANAMTVKEMTGIRPKVSTISASSILRRTVSNSFEFTLTKSLLLSYLGYAVKEI